MDFLFDFTELLKPLAILIVGCVGFIKYIQFKEKINFKQKQQKHENKKLRETIKYDRKIRAMPNSKLNDILRK